MRAAFRMARPQMGLAAREGVRQWHRQTLPPPAAGSKNETKAEPKRQIMKQPMDTRIKATALALCAVLTGCVGTGPNTQQGAVTGGALGAVTGAIIGNNSGGRNGAAGALIGAIVGAIAGGTIGNSVDQQNGTLYGQPLAAVPPPPPYAGRPEVIVSQPTPNAVWIPGYWEWTGAQYTWTPGYWAVPPVGFQVYVEGGWIFRGGGYFYRRPYWR
jgi:hypothetical protein